MVLPRLSRATLRRHLYRDTIKPGWTSSPSHRFPACHASCPLRALPRSDSATLSFPPRKCLFSPLGAGRGWEDAEGRGAPGPTPTKRAGMREDTLAVGEPLRGVEGAESQERKEEGTGRCRHSGWGGTRAPSLGLRTSNPGRAAGRVLVTSTSSFITFWSTNSGAE